MLSKLPWPLCLVLSFLLMGLNTVLWSSLILLFSPLKLMFRPFGKEVLATNFLRKLYWCWYRFIPILFSWIGNTKMKIDVPVDLSTKESYLLISNHVSWLDIPLIMASLGDKISTPIFFLKQELIWLPFAGQASWAIDMIFVNRGKRKKSDSKNKDLHNAQKKCKKLRGLPTTVINYVEGTRFTEKKHQQFNSKYKHLLAPKSAGVNFTLNAMGDQLSHILDVTLVYPENSKLLLFKYLSGRLEWLGVKVRKVPITPDLFGDYENDKDYRKYFKSRLESLWLYKDEYIEHQQKINS